ncbi:MAG: hypothetical protein GY927_20885 [bacterium]|nr:hypothetical protein [bacterium]
MELQDIRFTGQRLIEAYGNKGFRLSDGRLEGSILILPTGVVSFAADQAEDFNADLFAPILKPQNNIEILLLGTGLKQHFPSGELRKLFIEKNIALEVMDTGAACRTFNVLVSEDRRVAAALIAI